METLPKSERLSGRSAVSALMSKGRWGFSGGLKYCYLRNEPSDGANRIMVSVPKRFFKLYNSKDVNDFQVIKGDVANILEKIADEG